VHIQYVLVDDTWEQTSLSEPETDANANELMISGMEALGSPSS